MVLGEMTFDSMMYGNRNETTCKPLERQDLGEQLAAAIQNIQGSITEYVLDDLEAEDEDRSIPPTPVCGISATPWWTARSITARTAA